METKFSEPTAQIARKQKNSKDYRKQWMQQKRSKKQKTAEIHIVQNHEREKNEILKTLNESATHSLNSTAKTIWINHASLLLTLKLEIAFVERLELQIGHLQRADTGLDDRSAEFVRKMKQWIRIVEGATNVIFHSNWKLMWAIWKTGMNLLSKEEKEIRDKFMNKCPAAKLNQ
jgi:hypothetical protein